MTKFDPKKVTKETDMGLNQTIQSDELESRNFKKGILTQNDLKISENILLDLKQKPVFVFQDLDETKILRDMNYEVDSFDNLSSSSFKSSLSYPNLNEQLKYKIYKYSFDSSIPNDFESLESIDHKS